MYQELIIQDFVITRLYLLLEIVRYVYFAKEIM